MTNWYLLIRSHVIIYSSCEYGRITDSYPYDVHRSRGHGEQHEGTSPRDLKNDNNENINNDIGGDVDNNDNNDNNINEKK